MIGEHLHSLTKKITNKKEFELSMKYFNRVCFKTHKQMGNETNLEN